MASLSAATGDERKARYLWCMCQDLLSEAKSNTGQQNLYYSFKEPGEANSLGLPSDKHKQLSLLLKLEALDAIKVLMQMRDYKKTDSGTTLARMPLTADVSRLKELAEEYSQAPATTTNFSLSASDGVLYYREQAIIRTHKSHGDKASAGRRKVLIKLWDNKAIEANGVRVQEGIPQTREALRRLAGYPSKNSVDAAIKFFNRQLIASSVPAQIKSRDNKGQMLTLSE